MLILKKNEINELYTTVTDVVSSDNGVYILNATNVVTNTTTPISMSIDNAGNNLRYDKFTVNEASHSLQEGLYDYTITNLSGSIGEYGKLEVIGTEVTSSQYEKTTNTFTTYTKE